MFGELPKLFDRNFVIGYFLPVAIFVTLSVLIVNPYPIGAPVTAFLMTDLLVGTTALGLLSWVGGILLLALNRDLYRLMEGYRWYNPLRAFRWMEKWRYQRVVKERDRLDNEYRECIKSKKEFPAKSRTRRNEVMRQLVEEFPDKEEHLLPTPFGNVLRSFEVYPRCMYGFEAIDGWGRLLAVVPREYLELIDAARAQVDFWVNLGVVFILVQVEYISGVYIFGASLNWWVVGAFYVLGTIAPLRATSSAREWGDFVKSAFDVYRFKLLELLDIDLPTDRDKEQALWTMFSQAIGYRRRDTLPPLKKPDDAQPVKQASRKGKS